MCDVKNNIMDHIIQGPVLLLRHDAVAKILANVTQLSLAESLRQRQIAVVRQGPGTPFTNPV